MDAELNRRAARVLYYPPLCDQDGPARAAFLAALERAACFSALAPKYQRMLLQAEQARAASEERIMHKIRQRDAEPGQPGNSPAAPLRNAAFRGRGAAGRS